MRQGTLLAATLVLCLLATGCGNGGSSSAAEASESGSGTVTVVADGSPSSKAAASEPAAPIDVDWEDPEPPEAQALAEEVLHAQGNQDKITSRQDLTTTLQMAITTLVDLTTTLQMAITTLVDRTTGLSGFQTALEREETSIDDRLDRLGALVTETEVTIRLPGSVLFDFNSATIRPDAERALNEVAEVLWAYGDRPVRIEGHTDSIAADEYNQKLSEQRARSVSEWLISHGVDGSRISSVGHGESQPVANNSTADGRQLNRRVEIIIEKGNHG